MVRWITLFCALLLGAVQAHAAPPSDRALLVVSSHGRGDGKTQPGFEMDELSQAWLVFRANGLAVDIASPSGGPVIAEARGKLAATLPLSPAMAGDYDAIMVIGGKGAMFDLPFSQVLHGLLVEVEARGGIAAAVCHGPAVFARIRNTDGSHWISGRQVTGFADEEEAMFGKQWVPHFPFLLESELRRLGAQFSDAPIMLPHVVTDGRIITGQNPFSVAAASDAVVAALGRRPVARTRWADERSLGLVAEAIAGDTAPLAAAIKAGGDDIDVPLVAIWGYYRALQAKGDPAMLAPALTIMELAQPHFPEPELDAAIAKARAALANPKQP